MGTVTGKTMRLDVPDGSGWLEIKALGWLVLDNAKTKRLHQLADMAKSLKDLTLPTNARSTEPVDSLVSYDKLYLLAHGITAWSYGDTIDVEELDDPTADWAAREILAFSVPGVSEVGKASSRSTVTTETLIATLPRTNGS